MPMRLNINRFNIAHCLQIFYGLINKGRRLRRRPNSKMGFYGRAITQRPGTDYERGVGGRRGAGARGLLSLRNEGKRLEL